jgi:drug/metabolite transporter (DMT)-like permease
MIGYLYLTLAIVGTSFGQLLLKKHSTIQKKITLYLFFSILLLISVPFLIYLSLMYISFAIVFLSDALSIILVVIISSIFLNESLNYTKIAGIILIVSGIYMLSGRIT